MARRRPPGSRCLLCQLTCGRTAVLWPGSRSPLPPFVFVKCPRAEGGAGESRSGNREAGGGSVAGTAGGPRAAEPLLTVMLGKTSRRVVGAPRQRPRWCVAPQGQPGLLAESQHRGLTHPGGGQRRPGALALTPDLPLWTGTWPRTLSSVTVTSSGWPTSCARTPSRPAGPAAPAPGAWPTSASGRSRARSSGAQVAARPPVCLQFARGPRRFLAGSSKDVPGCGPQIVDLDLSGVRLHPCSTEAWGGEVPREDPDKDPGPLPAGQFS